MKILLTITLLVGTAVTLLAQGNGTPSSTPVPIPPGPLLKPVPSQVRWIINRKGAQSGPKTPAPAPPGAASSADPATGQPQGAGKENAIQFDTQVVGEKVGDITHIISFYSNGAKQEVWKRGLQQALVSPGWKQPIINRATEDMTEELDWVSAANFSGIQKIAGRDCIVFRDKVLPQIYRLRPDLLRPPVTSSDAKSLAQEERIKKALGLKDTPPIDPESLKIVAVACIDLESRLPMVLQMGNLVTSYKYEALPPDYTLSLPDGIATAIQVRAQQLQASTRRAVLP